MNVIALIADIIKSKEIFERENFQESLKGTLHSVSSQSEGIVSPYTLTLGDEFQAVYKTGNDVLMDIFYIIGEIHPVKIRFSLGVEKLTTAINQDMAIGMDGPAFHIAREGIDQLKGNDYTLLQIYGGEKGHYEFINSSLKLIFLIMDRWKENTMIIFQELYFGKKVKEIETLINISQRAIYKRIDTNSLLDYVRYFKSLEKEITGMIKNED